MIFTNIPIPNEYFGRLNKNEKRFIVSLFKGVSTLNVGNWPLSKSIEKSSILCSPKEDFGRLHPACPNVCSNQSSTIRSPNRVLTHLFFWEGGYISSESTVSPSWTEQDTDSPDVHRMWLRALVFFVSPSCKYFTKIQTHPSERRNNASSCHRVRLYFVNPSCKCFYAPQTKILEGGTNDEIRLFDWLFNG